MSEAASAAAPAAGGDRLAELEEAPIVISLDEPLPREAPTGHTAPFLVSGRAESRRGAIRALTLTGGPAGSVPAVRVPADAVRAARTGFRGDVDWPNVLRGQRVELAVEADTGDREPHRIRLGELDLLGPCPRPGPSAFLRSDGPRVVICMATWEPRPDRLRRQIDSIRAQRHDNWLCLINDDASSDTAYQLLAQEVAGDSRFELARNRRNLGFYRNFERCLERVPQNADFVALADQDDRWFEDKIDTLLGHFDAEGCLLVYSDMRIVNEAGEAIAPTYWVNRRNEFRDLDVVLAANTVTGAASMFRARLLEQVLPFPQPIGDAFHDHWIGASALAAGSLAYVARPLYDYYQYGESVIGHCDFGPKGGRFRRVLSAMPAIVRPHRLKQALIRAHGASLAVHRHECQRIELIARTIERRVTVADRRKRRALACYGRGWASVAALGVRHLRFRLRGATTDDAELRLAAGYAVERLERWRQRWSR